MSLSTIRQSVFSALAGAAGLPPIYYDNSNNQSLPNPPEENHLMAFILPSGTATVGIYSLNQERGLIQVNIRVKEGTGVIAGSDIAQQVLDVFPRNASLVGLRIDVEGSVAPSFKSEGWHVTAVTIPYQNIKD